MLLDRYQLEETDRHYAGCYLLYQRNRLFYCTRAEGSIANGHLYDENVSNPVSGTVPFSELELLDVPMGFYNTPDGALVFTRLATQGTRRGISSSNAAFLHAKIAAKGGLVADSVGWTESYIISSVRSLFNNPKKTSAEYRKNILAKLASDRSFLPVAINRDYAILERQNRSGDSWVRIRYLTNKSGIVGKFDSNLDLIIHPKASFMMDSIQEAFSEYTEHAQTISIAA